MTGFILLLAALAAGGPPDTLVVPLQEIVVTGARVPETALRTPAAITVVDKRRFDDSRFISLKDALTMVPGVLVQSRGGAQDVRVTIRGFGARGNGERSNAGNMRGIRVMTDGVPITEPDGRSSLDLVDLGSADRIEVVRSNSSTFYGNASGGVVHLRTHLDFDRPGLEVRERVGSFGYHREQGVAEFMAGSARGSFSLLNSSFDGWRDHSGSSTTMGQLRLAAPLGEATRLGLMLDGVSNLNRFPGALNRSELEADPRQADSAYRARDERRINKVARVGVSLDRAIGSAQDLNALVFVEPKVLRRSERNRFRDFTRYHLGTSATWRITSRWSETLEGVTTVGADEAYQDGSILFYDLVNGDRGTTVIANKREGAHSAGGFVQQEVRWSDRWSARVAARYDNLLYLSDDYQDPTLDAEKTFTRWTPKGSLSWTSGRQTVYAALGGGVEAPAFNEIDPPPTAPPTSLNPFLDAMYSTTYELGAKGVLASGGAWGGLDYDAALYWIDVRNEIVPFGDGAYFETAGRSRRRGAELGLDWTPRRGIELETAVTLSDNEYVDYVNDRGDFSDNVTPGLPSVMASGAARYAHASGLSAGVSVEHVGEYFADDANTPESRASAYTLLGASLGLERGFGFGRLRAFVAGDNLTDERYVSSVFINGLIQPAGGRYFEPGLPRSWSGGLTLRWR